MTVSSTMLFGPTSLPGPDGGVAAQVGVRLDDGVRLDLDRRVEVDRGRVEHADAGVQEPRAEAVHRDPVDVRKLGLGVDAEDLVRFGRVDGRDAMAGLDGRRDEVGQEVLALLAPGQFADLLPEPVGAGDHDAGVDFLDLVVAARAWQLDDADDVAVLVAVDAAVRRADGVVDGRGAAHVGEDDQRSVPGGVDHAAEGLDAEQGGVAVEDDDDVRALGEGVACLEDGVAGPELLGLHDDFDAVAGRCRDLIGVVTDDEGRRGRAELATKLDDLADHREPGDRVDELRQTRLHPRALASGEDHDADAAGVRAARGRGRF